MAAAMSISVAVVGPGRVGTALACLWSRSGCELVGFVGRSSASLERAIDSCGGRALDWGDLAGCDVVALTPGDDQLADVVARAAGIGSAETTLWLHTSGVHGLDALQPLAPARVGSLHPACPVPDPPAGAQAMQGKPAVVQGADEAMPRLEEMARRAGLVAVRMDEAADRITYHSACALAANGLTALADLAQHLFARCGFDGEARAVLVDALMRGALDAVHAEGPAAALTGPVQRGDADTVARHVAALSAGAPDALAAYRSLMEHAATLAARGGRLAPDQAAAMARRLRENGGR